MATKKAATPKPTRAVTKKKPTLTPKVSSKAGERYVALLRGINLGPSNKLPMPELCALLADLGASNVKHYIQSGNLAFDASAKLAGSIGAQLSQRIAARWGFSVPVVVRKQSAVVQVLRDNPFLRAGADIKALHVAFLADLPKAAQIAALDHARSPGDEFAVLGSEIYLLLPNGVARSKLTNAYFDRALATVSTIRNWNTVQILTTL
jgi:uncharacterized protein (DUF1697 family)